MTVDELSTTGRAASQEASEEPTRAQALALYARTHWPALVADATTLEEVGRALVTKASCGPRHWAGVSILREIGVLVDGSAKPS